MAPVKPFVKDGASEMTEDHTPMNNEYLTPSVVGTPAAGRSEEERLEEGERTETGLGKIRVASACTVGRWSL